MNRRVAVVTGSNKGIGKGIVIKLAQEFDGIVYLTSRNVGRGQAAVKELDKLGFKVEYHQLDIDSESSVLKFRDFLLSNHGGLDVLVNNAAIAYQYVSTPREEYAESVRKTIQTNYYSTLRACKILFPLLRPHSRVIHVNSDDGHLLRICGKEPESAVLRTRFADPDLTEDQLDQLLKEFIQAAEIGDYFDKGWPKSESERDPTWPNEGYIVSKVALAALTRIQQRQFDVESDITVNAVHPGYVATDMTMHLGPLSIIQGAVAPSWFAMKPASTPENPAPRGGYFWEDKQPVDWVNGPMPEVYPAAPTGSY